jgi:hypothetical protein
LKPIEIIQAIFYTISVIGIAFAYFQYRRNVSIEKQKVTNVLLDKFFDPKTLQEIRTLLDYDKVGTDRLKNLILTESDDDAILQEKFINYLNFFEYIGYLVLHTKQLDIEDANTLFGYYIILIDKIGIDDWLQKNGFKYTRMIIAKFKTKMKTQ